MAEKRSEASDFARLLAEAGGLEPVPQQEKNIQNLEVTPIRPADALNLSVQGKKALSSGAKPKDRVLLPEIELEKREDFQGNRIRISSTAKNFSRQLQNDVAWETRRAYKKDNPA